MLILGNTYSDAAMAISTSLGEYSIPAITAGATAPSVTQGNAWFFRVVPDNTSIGESVAGYVRKISEYETSIIVYEDNQYGLTLGDGFERSFQERADRCLTNRASTQIALPKP